MEEPEDKTVPHMQVSLLKLGLRNSMRLLFRNFGREVLDNSGSRWTGSAGSTCFGQNAGSAEQHGPVFKFPDKL